MDFITQCLLGAVAGHAAAGRSREDGGLGRLALAVGALGGAVPDLDAFLQPLADPALPFQLHRHFTHSLVFIPVAGLLAALPFLAFARGRRQSGLVYAAALVGSATHGLLDTMTSYGTHLLWPFVKDRASWDSMSIVDPLFSGLLLLGVIAAVLCGTARPTRLAMTLALAYIAFGFFQHHRALSAQRVLARERGHEIQNGRALPTIGNIIVFRSLYEAEGRLWADAVRVASLGAVGVREGSSMLRFTESDLPATASDRTREVFRGIESFSDRFVGQVDASFLSSDDLVLGDMRISVETEGFRPLWGIAIDARGTPAAWDAFGRADDSKGSVMRALLDDVVAPRGRFRPLTDH